MKPGRLRRVFLLVDPARRASALRALGRGRLLRALVVHELVSWLFLFAGICCGGSCGGRLAAKGTGRKRNAGGHLREILVFTASARSRVACRRPQNLASLDRLAQRKARFRASSNSYRGLNLVEMGEGIWLAGFVARTGIRRCSTVPREQSILPSWRAARGLGRGLCVEVCEKKVRRSTLVSDLNVHSGTLAPGRVTR